MIRIGTPDEIRSRLLSPGVMARPIVFLASDGAEGLTGQRIVATDFDSRLSKFRSSRPRNTRSRQPDRGVVNGATSVSQSNVLAEAVVVGEIFWVTTHSQIA
jgi:hypothetical protein